MAKSVNFIGLEDFPAVKQGDDLAKLIVAAIRKNQVSLNDGDVIVVAHKVVSKSEGRIVVLKDVKASERAEHVARVTPRDPRLVELVLQESRQTVKATPEILIVQNKQGWTCINAGVDKSNVEGEDAYALLPVDPDNSARRLRSEIFKCTGRKIAVIISDTYSRPFRRGQVEFAIGIAGLDPFRDYRGQKDLSGHVLKVKNTAVADEIASAAELLMGQGDEGMPVVIIKNLSNVKVKEDASSAELLISKDEDLFTGTL